MRSIAGSRCTSLAARRRPCAWAIAPSSSRRAKVCTPRTPTSSPWKTSRGWPGAPAGDWWSAGSRRRQPSRSSCSPKGLQAWGGRDGRLPPPREAAPPLRPALAARSRSCAKLRFSLGTLAPPRRAISRRRSGSIAAKPRRLGRRVSSSLLTSVTLLLHYFLRLGPCPAYVHRRGRPQAAAFAESPQARCPARIPAAPAVVEDRGPQDLALGFLKLANAVAALGLRLALREVSTIARKKRATARIVARSCGAASPSASFVMTPVRGVRRRRPPAQAGRRRAARAAA